MGVLILGLFAFSTAVVKKTSPNVYLPELLGSNILWSYPVFLDFSKKKYLVAEQSFIHHWIGIMKPFKLIPVAFISEHCEIVIAFQISINHLYVIQYSSVLLILLVRTTL